jgi:hypothetical protein
MRIGGLAAAVVLSCACGAILAACGGSSGSSSSTSSASTAAIVLSPADGTALPDAVTGQVYTQTFTVASGGTPPYTLTPSSLPNGFSFTASGSTGTLTGTPTGPASGLFQVTVTDARSVTATANYQLTIEPVGGVLTVDPVNIPNGTVNMGYNQALSVGNGTGPFSWGLSGTLPTGVTLGKSTTALDALSGTPTVAGTYNFTITVTDSSSPARTGQTAYTVTVN